jgi:ribosomal protein S18 acetylase RimI-like enzyme
MNESVTLKDGTRILIRDLTLDDLDASLAFFRALPPEDRLYLRNDVTRPDVVERRIRAMAGGGSVRLVGVDGAQIVADGSLESQGYSWKNHVAELRLVVARPYQRRSVGMHLARLLYQEAAKRRVEEIVAEFMAPQIGARRILVKLGFHEETVLPAYVKDLAGEVHDLVVMRCRLQELMREMEHHFSMRDWQRTR